MTPMVGLPGATEGAIMASREPLLSRSRMGFWCPVRIWCCASLQRHSRRTVASSRIMTAKGLAGLRLRARSRLTAASLVASQQRWKPPIPLTATMPPSRIVRRAAVMASRPIQSECTPPLVVPIPPFWRAFKPAPGVLFFSVSLRTGSR